jgi:hypothetical protein
MHSIIIIVASAITCCCANAVDVAVTLQEGLDGYSGWADTSIYEGTPTTNYGSAPNGQNLQVTTVDRQLHRFDLSSLPHKAQIISAIFEINVEAAPSGTLPFSILISPIITPWKENEATFQIAHAGTPWAADGMSRGFDFDDNATVNRSITALGFATLPVDQIVKGWIENGAANEGILLRLDSPSNAHAQTRMSEEPVAANRPKITIMYRAYLLGVNSGSGAGTYGPTAAVNLVANPAAPGMIFDRWIGDTAGITDVFSANTMLTMPASDATVTATYKANTFYTLNVINGSGSGSYTVATLVPLIADTPAFPFIFDRWTGDIAGIADVASGSTTLTTAAANATIIATYKGAPFINSSLSATALIGLPFSYNITALGTQPILFTASDLPPGLTFTEDIISGIPTTTGSFAITLTAVNAFGTDSKTLVFDVGSIIPGADSDGDGFSDEIETALGSNPLSGTSTPFGSQTAGTAQPINTTSTLKIKLNFAKSGKDSVALGGTLPVSNSPLGANTFTIIAGGCVQTFVLGKAGGVSGASRLSLAAPRTSGPGNVRFKVSLRGDLAAKLSDDGLTAEPVEKAARNIEVVVLYNSTFYKTLCPVSYTAKKSTGSAK